MVFSTLFRFVIILIMASTSAPQGATAGESINQRFANELSNRSSRDTPTRIPDYTNPEEKRKRAIQSWQEEIPGEVQRSISMTLEQLLIERPNASGSFDYRAKRQEITTADTNFTKTDDLGSRFFVNQTLEREGNEERPLTDLNEKSITENRKELQPQALSLKKRATGISTPRSSSRKDTAEILSRKINVRLHGTTDLKESGTSIITDLKSGKENSQIATELLEEERTLHQQTTKSKPIRTHLKQNKRAAEENNIPQALPHRRTKSQRRDKHFVKPSTALSRKRNSRFSRENSIQLNAAAAYQKALHSLQIGSTDLSGKTSIPNFGQPQFRFNPTQINSIRGAFDTIPLTEGNFRKIPGNQVAFIPPKIIYETRILPAPFMATDPRQKDFRGFPNFFTQSPDSRENKFNFASSNGQQYTPIPIKETIPVSEKSVDFENTFVTPIPSPEASLPPGANEISNHRYEAAVPIIKSVPLNHRPHSEIVEEAEDTPAQLEHSEYTRVTPDFSNLEDSAQDANIRNNYPRYAGKYTFGYRVSDHETGNDFGHEERRDGDITRGRYHVLLPDGRIQNVNYHVDHDGYHVKVSYHSDH